MKIEQKDSVLIVDDVPTNIKVLFELLNHSGFRISVAKSGESALKQVQEAYPDLILLDVMMPGIDGFETCRRLKADPKTQEIPVIFMTALSDSIDKVRGLQLGAVDYITKPLQHEEVLARINVHLELRKTRIKLVQQEKMSALGQLVAGVAHEINNPINFIHANLVHAQNYVETLLKVIYLYETYLPQPIPEVDKFAEDADLDFIKDDAQKLLQSMQVGTLRIQEIVQSLKVFSRVDEAACKAVNLSHSIDSTLMLLRHRLKAIVQRPEITLVKSYGSLPLVTCYASQMNQVFMNLLSNAIDAIDEKVEQWAKTQNPALQEYCPEISIRTFISNDSQQVSIQITDNGIGMSENVRQRMFNQFFTTKSVGKGTGLGLAISYQIVVEKHQGKLEAQSAPGKGTILTVVLPIELAP